MNPRLYLFLIVMYLAALMFAVFIFSSLGDLIGSVTNGSYEIFIN